MNPVLRGVTRLTTLVLALLTIASPSSHAATGAEIDTMREKALAWLYINQSGDGFWHGPGRTEIQVTGLALQAYASVGIETGYSRGAALTWLANAHTGSVEAMGVQTGALGAAGRDVANLLARLQDAREKATLSWGSYPRYQPSMPDTAVALDAFILSGTGYADAGTTLGWMVNTAQNIDGGWAYISPTIGASTVSGPSRLIPTARAALSLSRWASIYVLDSYITPAVSWLVGQQLPDGGFSDDPAASAGEPYETALALRALKAAQGAGNAAASAASAEIDAARDFLVASQDANGSWNDDPFATAAVVSALPDVALADGDADGIPDAVEPHTGTDPNVADGRSLLDPIGQGTVGTHSAELLADLGYASAINTALTASGPAQSFFINAGVLPGGITLDEQTGQLSGASTTTGTFNFEYTAVLADGTQETRVAAIRVATPEPEVEDEEIPVLPLPMLVLLGAILAAIGTLRRNRVFTLALIAMLPLGLPRDGTAAGPLPVTVSERIIKEYAGGRSPVRDPEAVAIEHELSRALSPGHSPMARRMFAQTLKPRLARYREQVLERLDRQRGRVAALGNSAAATAIAARAQALEEKIGGLISDIDGLEPGGPAARAAAVLSKLNGTVENLRAPRHPDRPVPTFSQEAPGPALSLPASSKLPAYITADAYERAGQMYAFNGDLLLLAAAPPTPGEAASCGYTSPDLADDGKDVTITQEIQDLAEHLDYSAARIFEYVANEIAFEPYYGALKGAQGTLETGAGSATDQSSLLIALFRASNIPARYVRGDVAFVGSTASQAEEPVNKWLQTESYNASAARLALGQNPTAQAFSNAVQFAHIWVEACVPYAHYRGARWDNAGHRWVPLDPSFETRRFEVGLSTAETFDFDAYLSGFNTKLPHEVFEAQVRQSLGGTDSLPDVGYRSEKLPLVLDILPASLPYHVEQFTDWSNSGAPETASLPDSHRYLLHVGVKNGSGADLGVSLSRRLAALLTVPLTLSFEGATSGDQTVLDDWRRNGGMLPAGLDLKPTLWVDGGIAAEGSGSVQSETTDNQVEFSVSLEEARDALSDPCTTQPGTQMINAVCFDGIAATNYHALQAYAFQAADKVLGDLADTVVENVNAVASLADDLDGTVGRFLHYAALKYMGDISEAAARVGRLRGTTGDSGLHLGLTSTQSHVEKFLDLPYGINKQGFLVDVPGGQSRARGLVSGDVDFEGFVLAGYAASAFETFIWQETARLDAVSTITGIQHASEQGSVILTINQDNRTTELAKVKTTDDYPDNALAYAPSFVTDVLEAQYLDQDFDEIKVPDERINFQGWEGHVLVATKFVLDAEPGIPGDQTVASASFPISGGFAGGYSVPDPTPVVTYNPSTGTGYVGGSTTTASGGGTAGDDQAIVHLGQGAVGGGSGTSSPHNTYAGDPVNLITGNFFHSERDLVIPYRDLPIVFERAYNSRNPADGPLGYGWTHSFNHRLLFRDENPDGVEDALDTDGITSSVVWVDGAGGEKHLSVTGDAGGVPIGAPMTTPDGFPFTLTREPDGSYRLVEKSGLAYAFASVPGQVGDSARLSRIVSRNANTLTMGYVGSELRTVTDDTGRAITFGYGSGRITSLTDWTGREHRYDYDGAGNLIEYRNPLAVAGAQPPVTYDYYTAADSPVIDHAIRSITLPKGNGLTFEYYADGRVFRHTNAAGETFTFQYNDFRRETLVTDARGFTTRTFFNQYGNPVEVIEPDGAVTTYEYTDPQDPYHRTAVVDALGNRTEYAYDAASNITRITLPSGNTVEYGHFTAFGQPGKVKDARGNVQLVKYDGAGNVTDEIVLAAGIGAGLDPTTYQPELHPGDVLAWTRHGYDSAGNKTSSTQVRDIANIRGLTRTWTFDAHQRYATQLERCGDKDGDGLVADDACDTTPLVFDTLGRLTEGVNGRFEPIEIHYDALNRVTRATDALGQLREYRFDANGNPVHESLTVDVNGIPTLVDSRSAEYGPADRKRLAIDAGGFATRFQYDAMGNLTATTNPDNFTVGFTHDPLGRVLSAFDEEGREARRTLDVLGRMRRLIDPNGNADTFTYYGPEKDARLEQSCDALERCTTFDYDANGNVTVLTDNDGNTTLTTYDALDRPVRIVEPAYDDPALGTVRPVTVYAYDTLGNLTETRAGHTDAAGTNPGADVLTTQQVATYDDWGRTLTETDALGRTTTFTPDVHGDIVRIEDPKGQIVERDFAFGGVLTAQRSYAFAGDPSPHVITYTRNALGQATRVVAPEITYDYAYDVAHRLVRVTDSRGNARLEYDWSPGGLLDTLRDDRGRQTDYLYDPTGRLTTLWAPDGELIGYTFDDAGRLTRRDLPGGTYTEYTYFDDDALATLETRGGGGALHSQSYTYDTLGRRATMDETLGGAARSHTYGYDALSRLLSVDSGGDVESWTYDAFGNRLSHTPPAGPVAHYAHDDAHQLLEIREGNPAGPLVGKFLYDANGNLTKQCTGNFTDLGNDCTGDDALTLTYDALDRQVAASRTGIPAESYQYDPQGRRIAKTIGATTTHYHYDGSALYQQVEGDWANPVARYLHGAGIDTPLLHSAPGQTLVYHQDGHNSVVATTDAATGALVATQGYGPWGNPNAALTAGPAIPTYGYTGREPDATGLVYYRARYYHPAIGRFTQPDPLGFIDGVNRYAYALNSPVNFIDPTGTVGEGSVQTPQANNQGGYWGSGVVGTFLPNIDNAIRNGVGDATLGGTLTGAGKGVANDAIGLINFAVGGVTRLAGGSGDPVLSQFTIAPEERLGAALGESAALATGLGAAGKLAAKGIAKLGARSADDIAASRLAQDVAVNPTPPRPLPTSRPIGASPAQNSRAQQIIRDARSRGATDIRVNQQQVNAAGKRVGVNRPDVQYTEPSGCRTCVEIDRTSSTRGLQHKERILANDPSARVILETID